MSRSWGEATLSWLWLFDPAPLAMVYLLASATSRFDLTRLSLFEVGARLRLASLIHPEFAVNGPALLLGAAIIGYHFITARSKPYQHDRAS